MYISKNIQCYDRLKKYCIQKKLGFVDNHKIKEHHLEAKKLHLNQRGNATFVSNLLKYMRSFF